MRFQLTTYWPSVSSCNHYATKTLKVCVGCLFCVADVLPVGGLYVPSSLYEAPNNETDEKMRLYPHVRFSAQVYVTGWRVRGESLGGQGGVRGQSACESVGGAGFQPIREIRKNAVFSQNQRKNFKSENFFSKPFSNLLNLLI